MPRELLRAHTELDKAVEKSYRPEPFRSDRERVEHLFRLYEQLTAPLLPATPARKRRGRKTQDAPPPAPPVPNPDQAAADAAHFYSPKEEPPPYRTS